MSEASAHMDAMYRYQRYIYDITRKPYLLGRDAMIAALAVPVGGTVLEIGCGTGRNLIKAARRYPACQCYGLDVSGEMLVSAHGSLARSGLAPRVMLAQADATDFDPTLLFGREKFDRIFISYALSMIPMWQKVLAEAATHLAPGGALHVVDFGEQEALPRLFRTSLRRWLAWFDVHPRGDLAQAAQGVAAAQGLVVTIKALYRGYGIHIVIGRPVG